MEDYAAELQETNLSVIKDASKSSHDLDQLRIFYEQAADAEALQKSGLDELRPYLDRIEAVSSIDEMNALLVAEDFPFSPFVQAYITLADTRDVNIVNVGPNLALVDAITVGGVYYQDSDDPQAQQSMDAAIANIASLSLVDLMAAGMDKDAANEAFAKVLEFEKKHGKYADYNGKYAQRDFGAMAEAARGSYFTLEELCAACPNFPMKATLDKVGKGSSPKYVSAPEWLEAFNGLWTDDNIEAIKLAAEVKALGETRPYRDPTLLNQILESAGQPVKDAESFAYEACNQQDTFAIVLAATYIDEALGPYAEQRLTELTRDLIGGAVFTPWIPQLPVNVSFDPFGFLIITWNMNGDPYGIRSDDESSADEGWKKYPRGSAEEQYNKLESDMADMSGKYTDAASRKGFVNQVNFSQLLSASVNVQLLAGLRWEKGAMEGLLGLQAALTVGYTLSENFTVGPVPVLVEFGFDMSAIISLSCGVVKPADAALDEFSKYTFDYSNSGVTFTLLFSPRLSVGIGVKGVASISLQGVFGISLFYNITNPRIVMGLMAKAQVVVQFILFSAAFPLWSWNDPSFIDSGKEASNQLQAQAYGSSSNDYAGHTLADLFGELKIIPESALAETAEHEREGVAPQPNYALGKPQALGGDLKAVSIQAASASAGTGGGHGEHTGEGGALVAASLQLTTEDTASADGSMRRFIPFVHLDADGNATPVSHRLGGAKSDSPESGLTAQATSNSAKPGVAAPSFKALNTASAENASLPSASVHSLADSGSLVPSSDMKLAESVLSNPRTKTIVLDFTTYALRIATVMVAGQPRTRVIMDQVSGSRKTIAVFDVPFNHSDFQTMPPWQGATQGLNHDDYFDYDFDVGFEGPLYDLDDPSTDVVYWIHLFIISGKRAQDDKTGIALAATDQVFSYVRAEYSIYYGLHGSEMYTMNAKDAGLRASEGAYHSYSCPHIDTFADPRLSRYTAAWDDPIVGVRMFYLDRYGDTPEAALSTQAGSHAAVSWFAAFSDGIFLPSADDLAKLGFDDARCTQMQVDTIPYRGGVWHQVALRTGDELAYYLARIDFGAKSPGATELSFDNLTLDLETVKCDAVNSRMRMMPWRKSDIERPHMLAVIPDDQGLSKVCEAKWTDAGTPELSLTELGPTNVAAQSIGVSPDGQWLYFPAQRDGSPGFDYSEAGSGTQKPEVNEHTIMACRRFGDRFSDAFPFAQVEHAMDELVGLGDTDGSAAMSFISTEITDAASGRANLWYTSMPHVRSAIVVSCECTEALVGAGTDASFRVALRNVGNVFLSSVKVSIAESEGSAEITFSPQTLCDSHYNPSGDGARDDGLLAPGKTSVYLATLHIPDDWEGEHDITLSVADATEATASANGGLSAQASSASEPVLFTPPAANGPHDRVVVQVNDEASSEKLNPSDVIASPGADTDGGDDARRDDSAPTRGAPAMPGLPGTGDRTPALLGVAAAAAVMAGAAAWKANRMANKASEAESDAESPEETWVNE